MIEPCNGKSLWVVDSVILCLCVRKDQRGNPDSFFLRVSQSVHVDVAFHVVQLQPEVVPCHVQVELVPKDLSDLIDVQDLDQVNSDVDLHLDQDAIFSDGEGSVVGSIVGWLNDQRAIVLVREVVAVRELVEARLQPVMRAEKGSRELVRQMSLSNCQVWAPVPTLVIAATLLPLTEPSIEDSCQVSVSSLYLMILWVKPW